MTSKTAPQIIRHDAIVDYRDRSLRIAFSHINDIGSCMQDYLCYGRMPFELPKKEERSFSELRQKLRDAFRQNIPGRNTFIRTIYEKMTNSSLNLLVGPRDLQTGSIDHAYLYDVMLPEIEKAQGFGFDIKKDVITFDVMLETLVAASFPKEHIRDHLIRQFGVIGSMFNKEPCFGKEYAAGFIYYMIIKGVVEVTGADPRVRFSGNN